MVNTKVTSRQSAYIHYLHHDRGKSVREIQKGFPELSVSTVWRHAMKLIHDTTREIARQTSSFGRRRKLSDRDERAIVRALLYLREHEGNFSARRVQVVAGMEHIHVRTIRRVLNQHGYGYRQARRKGLMSAVDRKKRVNFAKQVLSCYDNKTLWKESICFYLDGKSFVHKLNPKDQARAPRTKIWRKRNEGLKPNCTAKRK